jgi:hypothetical protein
MKFAHGSSQNILDENNETNSFELFDYVLDKKGKISINEINNGVDGEGAGIYAMIGDSNEAINNAKNYSGDEEHDGYVYILNLNIEEHDLMNNREADEIPVDDWVDALECYVSNIQRIKYTPKDRYEQTLNVFLHKIENGEDVTIEDINLKLKKDLIEITLDEYCEPNEFDEPYEWLEVAMENYSNFDPCSYIEAEGGSRSIVENAIENSDNLQETLYNIWKTVAIRYSQDGIETYNKTFQESIIDTLHREHDLTAGHVNDGNFAVIFDVSEITVDRVIDIKKEYEEKNNIEQYLKEASGKNTHAKTPKNN